MKSTKKKVNTQVLSEAEVLERLDIPNFRYMTKDKIMSFCSMIPEMDADVAKAALGQFPKFVQMTTEVVACYKELMSSVLRENATSTKEFNASCDTMIDSLNSLLQKKRISRKEKKVIIDAMMTVLQMKAEKDSENKAWLGKVVSSIATTATAFVAIAGAILGLKFLKK